jgi:hypothetical protein
VPPQVSGLVVAGKNRITLSCADSRAFLFAMQARALR